MSHSKLRDFALPSGCDLEADIKAPCGRSFFALLEAFRATGGTAPSEILGRLLEEHQVGNAASLAKLPHTGQVFGFKWRASLWVPMFQFNSNDLDVKAGVRQVRAELPSLWSGWTLASWFAESNTRLDGRRLADLLDSDLEAVLWAARTLHPHEDLVLPFSTGHRPQEVASHP